MPYFILTNNINDALTMSSIALNCIIHQAGLLASGSTNCRAFPFHQQWLVAAIVPGYSGGPTTDLHRLP